MIGGIPQQPVFIPIHVIAIPIEARAVLQLYEAEIRLWKICCLALGILAIIGSMALLFVSISR